jgi:hypothetical protein
MTYIRDLIDLPDRVHQGDFVLKLSESLVKPEETVKNYVVPTQLVNCYDTALALIRSALEARVSKAAYLHGSFGSGKSHFMAILHLILSGDADARSIRELAPVIAKHNVWMEGKRFLMTPYHLVGAPDMESALLGGYAQHVHTVHPDAPLPAIFKSGQIFDDACRLRERMGDESFFAALNSGRTKQSEESAGEIAGWGEIGKGWNAENFERVINSPPDFKKYSQQTQASDDRDRLVGDLVQVYFSAIKSSGDFVDLDTGLAVISRHAKALGYDGVILFLDELILWLASRASEVAFVNREGSKLSKLVESQTADRPIPIISFVARQRDLKELVGDNIPGAEKLGFTDTLRYWEARFTMIKLEDRNLAAIAEKRILKPNSETSRQLMDEAFRQIESIREEAMNVLLTSQADRRTFRQVYPFSPALIETLVAVSSLLQRERTALKVMLHLLVEQKEHLKLGEIIPVGDLFDAISEGEAFSDVMRSHFEKARKYYHGKVRPFLESKYNLRFEDMDGLPYNDEQAVKMRSDDRLIKTLLLAALAPEVESFRNLTAAKLAALNQGVIKSPITGREGQIVLNKCREWAAKIGQIKISDGTDHAIVSVQLTGVDTQSIIEQAQSADNHGNRARKLREMICGQLGVEVEDKIFSKYDYIWRATRRSFDLDFYNIREMRAEQFASTGDNWRIIIDYPLDAEGHGPRDDLSKLEELRPSLPSSRTILWIPSFLSEKAQSELGILVRLDHILTGDSFSGYVNRLSPQERAEARTLLENQRDQLKHRIIGYLEGIYGIAKPEPGSRHESLCLEGLEHFATLDHTLELAMPIGANLKGAFENLLDQALKHQFPAHPQFEAETRLGIPVLKTVLAVIESAAQIEDERVEAVEKGIRKDMRLIANPLKLGEMHETPFLLGQYWKGHFQKKAAGHQSPMTVEALRRWIDEPQVMGLPREIQNLIILSFATQANLSFTRHGGPFPATIENLPDELVLREEQLPSQEDWEAATARGGAIFGITASPLLNASNLAKFVSEVRTIAHEKRADCGRLEERLQRLIENPLFAQMAQPLKPVASNRLKTAQATRALIEALSQAGDNRLVETLARAEIATTESAMGTSLKSAPEVIQHLTRAEEDWSIFEGTQRLKDERRQAASIILDRLKTIFQSDEYVTTFSLALKEVKDKAVRLVTEQPAPPKPAPMPAGTNPHSVAPVVTLSPPTPGGELAKILDRGTLEDPTEAELEQALAGIRERVKSDSAARLRLTWEIYRP